MLSDDKIRAAAERLREFPAGAPIAQVLEDLARERNAAAADAVLWRNLATFSVKALRASADSVSAVAELYDDHLRDFEAPGTAAPAPPTEPIY